MIGDFVHVHDLIQPDFQDTLQVFVVHERQVVEIVFDDIIDGQAAPDDAIDDLKDKPTVPMVDSGRLQFLVNQIFHGPGPFVIQFKNV